MRFAENVEDGVSLAVAGARVTRSALAFTYRATNGSGVQLHLVNRLFHRRGAAGFLVDPNLVYASLDEGGMLVLRKQLMEIPEEIDVEAPEVPYVTPVAPGVTFSETVRLTLPIRPRDPYLPQPEGEPHTVSQFTFALGYLISSTPVGVVEVRMPSGEVVPRIDFGDLMRGQRLKVAGPLEARVATTAMCPAKPR